jgi:hypothetical protein
MTGEIKNASLTIYPPNELPYVGQVVDYKDDWWSIMRIAKIEWAENGIRVNFVMQRLEDDPVVVTDTELRKAKKSRFKVL